MRQIRRDLRKNRRSKLLAVLVLMIFLSACGGSKQFEAYNTIEANSWQEEAVQTFSFEITEQQQPLDLFFTIKNGLEYPYHNLYVKYRLVKKDEDKDQLVAEDLVEFILFNPKTGAPLGSGSSGWYDQEFPLKKSYQFDAAGQYEIQFQQYMRKGSLNDVATVGFAFDSPKEQQ